MKKLLSVLCGAALLMLASCSNGAFLADEVAESASRAVLSGSNGSVTVNNMNGNSMTVTYSPGRQLNYARLYVSEGNGTGLVLANAEMSYSGGKYTYTFSNGTFYNGAKVYICVLANNGGEYCVPQGNLAQSTSWASFTYGDNSGSSSSNSGSSSDITSGATYKITAKCSGKALDVAEWSTTPGTNIHQWGWGGDQANQKWILTSTGDGYYTIVSVHSGFCLDVQDWSTATGANVLQWHNNKQANQKWAITKLNDGYYKIINQHSGKALDVSGSSTADGANVQQWDWNDSGAQHWKLEKLSGTSSNTNNNNNNNNSGSSSVGAGQTSFVAANPSNAGSFTKLVWSDEFEGNSLNMENWKYDTGNGGWGNAELENYTNGSNVSVSGGLLTITADNNLNSARIKTQDKKYFKYGKVEARIKCDQGTGSWPAFWMLGQNMSNGVGWPYCGEIDIMEHANWDGFIYNTCHWNANGQSTSTGYSHASWGQTTNNNYWNVINNFNFSDWHTYSITWTSSHIAFYVDGIETMGMDIGNASNGTDCFNNSFFILLNFAMGGQFTGIYNRNQFSNLPWHMYVDYVRVYQ